MNFWQAVQQRYSVRAFQDPPVADAALNRILQAANDAPSAGNLQAYEIVVVRDAARKQQLVKAAWGQEFIAQAPVVLVFCANPDRNRSTYGERGATLYAMQDATIACAYTQLAATAQGLGTCWIGAFTEDAVHKIINPPASWRPVAMLPVGVAAAAPQPRERRPLAEITHE
jgi:nitroreductase